jgi:tetratricopeptide (TPR) repeat protein
MRTLWVALALSAFAIAACTTSVEHGSLTPRSPDEVWEREFARAQRFEGGRMFADAERHYLRALDAGRVFDSGDPRVLRTRLSLADLYTVQGRIADAEAQYVEVIRRQRITYGDSSEATADSLNRLGVLLADDDRAPEALPMFEESLRIRARRYGPDHPSTIATAQNLAAAYHVVGRYGEAEALYVRSLEAYEGMGEKVLGLASVTQNNLARLYRSMGRGSEAESLHLHAISLSIEVNGPKNPNVAIFSHDLANLLAEQERYPAAEAHYKTAIRLFISNYGRVNEPLRSTLIDYAAMLRADGQDHEAASYEASAAEIASRLDRAAAAGAHSNSQRQSKSR